MPQDPWDFAQAQAFNSYLASTVHVAHAHWRRGYRWADEESSFADMRRKVPQNMRDAFGLIETEYLRGPWVMGGQFTVCDIYLFTVADWLERDDVDPAEFPRVLEHRERVRARPAVRKVLAEEAA
jgi:glutathione S-transferase